MRCLGQVAVGINPEGLPLDAMVKYQCLWVDSQQRLEALFVFSVLCHAKCYRSLWQRMLFEVLLVEPMDESAVFLAWTTRNMNITCRAPLFCDLQT